MNKLLHSLYLIILFIVIIFAILLLISPEPVTAFMNFVTGPFSNLYTAGNLFAIAAILIICGAGVSIAFQAGLFNLGGEAQIYSSALVGTMVGLVLPQGSGILGILIVIVISMLTGAAIAALSGFLKYRYKIHELISSFLLSGGLLSLTDYLISNPLRDQESFLQTTKRLPQSFFLPSILPPSNLTITILIACIVAVILWIWLYKMPGGYELRVFGLNKDFAEFGNISKKRYTILPLMISGACFGLAGALMVLSTQHAAIVGFSSGYGWNGIVIALIAGNNPILTIPAALLLAWIETGTRTAMAGSSVSFEMSEVIRGMILLLVTLRFFKGKRRRP